jgi:hypothetical protein
MPIDPVQSIRVAANLAERFGVLMTLGSRNVAELELKIGEAQQLYPEIWRHLDDARTALAERGRDVSAFDDLRRGELAQLGVTDTESTTSLDYAGLIMGQLGTVQFKSATFNAAGYRRALAACRALMGAMPEIDWKAVAEEEEREMRAAGSLHSAKWTGIAKVIVIAAVLASGAYFAYRAMSTDSNKPRMDRRHEEIERQRGEQRLARIAELRDIYNSTCDRAAHYQLVQLLRDASQEIEASRIEHEHCVPVRHSCDAVKEAIGARVAASFGVVKDETWAMTCEGILMSRTASLEAGLAVVLSARDHEGRAQTLRGVASLDGKRDSVAFGTAPGTRLVGIGDLDDSGSDELVFTDSTSLTVTTISGPGFVDIEGPPMPSGCSIEASVESSGKRKLLVLSVPDAIKRKGCPTPGRHVYALRDGALVESD